MFLKIGVEAERVQPSFGPQLVLQAHFVSDLLTLLDQVQFR